jgi:precorrin-3B synthase
MTAPAKIAPVSAAPSRRGACPGLWQPLPTGDGFLVRIIPIGTMPLSAFAGLCACARRHGNGILEITARGSIQVRGLSAHSAPQFAAEIATLGIAAEGVPILCNPLAGLDPAEIFDASVFAGTLRRVLTRLSLADRLDPKVSIVIDGGGQLNLARITADIRVCAQLHAGETMLRLAIAGHHSSAFDLGMIRVGDGLEAISRLLAVLAQHGMRARDIVTAEGLGAFDRAVAFARGGSLAQRNTQAGKSGDTQSAPRQSSDAIGRHVLRDGSLACGVGLAFGHAEAHALEQLTKAAAAAGARGLRTAPNRSLLAVGLARESGDNFFTAAARLGFITAADDPRRHVIACAGAPRCASAFIAARAIAPRLAEAAMPYLTSGTVIHVSGCAKGCAYPAAAALTVVGTPGDCALVANGSAAGAPFTTAPLDQLPAIVAAHLRDRRGTTHRAGEDISHA